MLVYDNYKNEHNIEFYARELCISKTYLSRIIQKITNRTANYFISGMLISEACRLLAFTNLTLQNIAEELNFSDQSAFGKFFKAKKGISPFKYRNSMPSE